MREIKFRAFLKLTKEIVDIKKIDFENNQISFYKNNDDAYLYVCDFKNIELMQFTGLCDKNGEKIYENDIVEITYLIEIKNSTISKEYNEKSEFIGVVKSDLLSGFYIQYICDNSNVPFKRVLELGADLEIVGNIFDNPELLEGNYERN